MYLIQCSQILSSYQPPLPADQVKPLAEFEYDGGNSLIWAIKNQSPVLSLSVQIMSNFRALNEDFSYLDCIGFRLIRGDGLRVRSTLVKTSLKYFPMVQVCIRSLTMFRLAWLRKS